MNTNRYFADPEHRIHRTNRVISIGNFFVTTLTIVFANTAPSILVDGAPFLLSLGAIVMTLCSIPVILLAFLGKLSPRKTANFVIGSVLVTFIFADLLTSNAFFAFLSYSLVLAFFLYYDKKLMRIPTICVAVFATGTRLFDCISGFDSDEARVSTIAGICFNLIFAASAMTISLLTEKYNADIFGVMDDQVEKQKETTAVLEDVLSVIKEETGEVSLQLNALGASSDKIVESIQQIESGTRLTCESIEQQSTMTGNIQELIDNTADKARRISDITSAVQDSVVSGNGLAEGLSSLSDEIREMNVSVTEAMNRLQDRMTTMQDVVASIAAISNKTNLLALNASIEAARAGEAGRGFAVVADEIRVLSEQTKASTENIRHMIEELGNDASEASRAVDNTVASAGRQQEMIGDVTSNFNSIDGDMRRLSEEVASINTSAEELIKANTSIVDAVSQLSAIGEEVTASTSDVLSVAVSNKENVGAALGSVDAVVTTARKIDEI